MQKRLLLIVAPVLAAGLIAAGCGDDDDQANTSTTGNTPAASDTAAKKDATTESGASALRSTLTAALQEHVYLAGIAINTGVGAGLDSKEFKAAADTLDKNSQALAGAIGGVYGDEAGDQFLTLWRDHIGFFVEYTKAKAEGDEKGAEAAREELDGYRSEFGAFIASANPNLTAEAVAEELIPHVDSVFDTIDSVVAGKTDVFDKLAEAASHMPGTANVLAGAIAKQFPDKFSGNVEDGASALRSTLTAALQEHVYLAGIAINTGVGAGLDSKEFKAAADTLDKNSQALAGAIGGVYGDEAGDQFLTLWRDHIGFFVEYTKAKAEGDEKGAEAAREELDGYRSEFGAFIASANPNLTAEAVAEELIPHVDSVFDTIDSVVAGKTDVFDKLAEAASHMPGTANVLAGAIAKQFPDKFPAA